MNNPDQPINPVTTYTADGDKIASETFSGLTKREQISALAMQGLLSNRRSNLYNLDKDTIKLYAEKSLQLAEELLKQLSNPQIK